VGALYGARPHVEGGGDRLFDARHLHQDEGADDVGDGVDGPNFVEMDILRGGAVDLRLRFGQKAEGRGALLLHPGGEGARPDDGEDVGKPPVGVILKVEYRYLRAGYTAPASPADGDFQPVIRSRSVVMVMIVVMIVVMVMSAAGKEDDALHGFEEGFPVQSEVEQRSEKHVAGDAGETVEIQGLHQIPPVFASGRVRPFFPILSFPGQKNGGGVCYPYKDSL